jgi:hypothetical protein
VEIELYQDKFTKEYGDYALSGEVICFLKLDKKLIILCLTSEQTITRIVLVDVVTDPQFIDVKHQVKAQEIEIAYAEFERRIRLISIDIF